MRTCETTVSHSLADKCSHSNPPEEGYNKDVWERRRKNADEQLLIQNRGCVERWEHITSSGPTAQVAWMRCVIVFTLFEDRLVWIRLLMEPDRQITPICVEQWRWNIL